MTERRAATPLDAWTDLAGGNARFAAGAPQHPRQDDARRELVAAGQAPYAAILGCSDSRVSAELLFDQGLGDLFVVRNAGQLAAPDAIASLEFAVAVLGVPLIVVLAHEECGAVAAAIAAEGDDPAPLPPRIAQLIAPIRATVRGLPADGRSIDDVQAAHLSATTAALLRESEIVSDAVAEARLGVVGAAYRLREGRVEPRVAAGVGLDSLTV